MDFLTKEKFDKMCNGKLNYESTVELFKKYEINTPNRVAMFFAQCSHESGGFKYKSENLNYSADALNKVFPYHFGSKRNANEYARNPEKIANVVYNDANRSAKAKLGNTEPGDGWKFRGRGYIQLTGRNNYTSFANKKGISLDECVEYCDTDDGAVESALFFWERANLNSFCDKDDILGATKRINGGTNGLKDRENHYNKYKSIINS